MTGGELWQIFLEDGAAHATRIVEGVREERALEREREVVLLADAYAVATLATLMGMGELARLAQTMEQAIQDGAIGAELHHAARTTAETFEILARPDASGARIDEAPLAEARRAIEAVLGDRGPARSSPPVQAPRSSSPVSPATGDVWVPTVDEDMIELFFEEAHDRLNGLAEKLLALEERPGDGELVREIFRDLHTVKGSSGMVGLDPMKRLAHAAEDLVGQVRDGARIADRAVVDALLGTVDALRMIAEQAQARGPIVVETTPLVRRLRDPSAAGGATGPGGPASAGTGLSAGAASAGRTEASRGGTAGADGPAPDPALSRRGAPSGTLRVDFEKLDLLLNLVGELVLSKAGLATGIGSLASLGRELKAEQRLARKAQASGAALRELTEELSRVERVFHEVAHDLDASSGRLDRVSAELRDQVMKLRMVPIGGVFRKYHRTVRDLAHGLGKKVRLELSGEETELDKLLVEQLDEPLMHLVRNAVDHGVEPAAVRAAAGKPEEGLLTLSAAHRGNQIVITLRDDGGGIDPARVRAKAIEKGIADPGELEGMSDAQVLDLIFRPGFSTAARISEVSGRGVGMDVVRETIVTRLKGAVDVSSDVGKGSTFTLRLPLTLAIIQVVLARAAGETFCVPLDVVTRTLAIAPSDMRQVWDRETLPVGDRQVPLIRIGPTLELAAADHEGEQLHAILVDVGSTTYGLVCDRLLGKQEIVIKSLGDVLEQVPCAAGATLLGDRPAIILDVPALVQRAIQRGRGVAPRAAGSQPVPAPSAARQRVLLVEDSDVVREALRRQLEKAGYDVTEARDGREGLALALESAYDLISTDVMMPHMDGYELTRALRASDRHRDTPIIMVTSRGEKIDRVRGFDAGVDDYITKPHDQEELIRAVNRHLRGAS